MTHVFRGGALRHTIIDATLAMPNGISLAPRQLTVTKKTFLSSPCALFPSFHHLSRIITARYLFPSAPKAPRVNALYPPIRNLPHIHRRNATMSEKLIPKEPSKVQVIRNVTPNVVTVSVPFLRFEKIPIGGRATIIKLTSGALAVFSPVALTDEVKAKITELGGNVGYLIAGDIEHHIFLTQWKTEYPAAKLIGPKGLPERRKAITNDPMIGKEEFDFLYDEKNAHSAAISDEFAADFEVELVTAHKNQEIVLFYKPDRVLIEADLMFNLPPTEQYSKVPEQKNTGGLLKKIFYSLNSTAGPAKGHKRLIWFAISNSNKDRPGFNESIKRIHGWDFNTLIPCHGDTIEGTGKETFAKIFDWHINGKK
ncbi:hypothetical protein RRF57_008009 [Xylaria bambusicola]|uniref:Uncharacterized protein n=1 Tax=Xylaria bambusicola TaxID=326684 RepID=A0AAN7UH25_9PEZI